VTSLREPLTLAEVANWLNTSAQRLNEALTGDQREQVAAELRLEVGVEAPFRLLASLSLLADCLRVAHLAIEADGKVEADEILRVRSLVAVAAPRYFQVVSRYEPFAEAEFGEREIVDFLRMHRHDEGPFGNANAIDWRGLRICQRIGDLARNETMVHDHERMLVRIMETVFAGRDSETERAALQGLRDLFERKTGSGPDPRVVAFCRPDGPEVFSSVAFGSQIFERDPFDVDTIHADARSTFVSQVERVIAPGHREGDHGRTLLVLGGAGSGKTHLLRAFRTSVHELALGYVGYLQMSSDVGDYARYVLIKLIDSLERPYDLPSVSESALLCISDGLTEHAGVLPKDAVERLRSGEITPVELPAFVGGLVDRLSRVPALAEADSDLLQALLLLQRRDPALHRRVVKFLRCESLTSYEQQLLGGLAPRLQPEDPGRTLEQIGRLVFALDHKALVLLVDQIEDAIPDAAGHERIQRAINVLRQISDAVPSTVIVLACLDDVYERIRGKLVQSVLDRIEREPPPVRLVASRSRSDIERMLVTRLEYLYETFDVPWREYEPLFPFGPEQLDELTNQHARDCLAYFHKFQALCIGAQDLVAGPPPEVVVKPEGELAPRFDLDWSDALVKSVELPEDDAGLLALIERGIHACSEETGIKAVARLTEKPTPRLSLQFDGRDLPARLIEFCNRQAQGGHLGTQIEKLRKAMKNGHMAVALRTSEFSFGVKTAAARAVGELVKAGGLALSVEDGDLRSIAAFDTFAAANGKRPGFLEWRRASRPLGRLTLFRKLLDLDGGGPIQQPPVDPPPVVQPLVEEPRLSPSNLPQGHVRLGATLTLRADPVTLDVEALKVHAAFLGGTGSGKTTLALNVIEQLLERGVSALLVDRKGDLARYASKAWWDETPSDPEAARRKAALRGRVDVDLYTPGDATGRPLRIPLIPPGIADMTSQEREQVAKVGASGLATMLEYGRGAAYKCREAILKKAIELHADNSPATLRDLQDTIARPDPELIAQVGNLTKHFSKVAEDLDMLAIQRGSFLSGDGEVLDLNSLLTPRPGRSRLIIISAVALTETSILQFWVSRLLVELGRLVRRQPSPTLKAVAFFDEADLYIPAVSSPPTKEPMFDLLRRARSGGVGVLLASQNTGDFDYKARDNINTWCLGKIAQDRAIEKMRNLLAGYPNVATRLASQSTGSFFLLNPTLVPATRELRADRSLMKTEQLPDHEVAAIARAGKPPTPAPTGRPPTGEPARRRAA
jgi:hypothetical protein